MKLELIRELICNETHSDEHATVSKMLYSKVLTEKDRDNVLINSKELVLKCRSDKGGKDILDSFLQEFGLSNKEGVALMCMAESLLRIPDYDTANNLIAEKIISGNWKEHKGKSDSVFVNASTWGLLLTGKVVDIDEDITGKTKSWLSKLSSKLSEPVIKSAVLQAMKIMGGHYVLGRNIDEGIKKGTKKNDKATLFSFDMLGEAARNDEDAINYFTAYENAILRIGENGNALDVCQTNGISVKLSALHPRYHFSHTEMVMNELYPRIKHLCMQAKKFNIGLSIDAEESERLDISLSIFETLAKEEELACWNGLGFVLQAYQKRAPLVADWLVQLAKDSNRKIMVRLVKGAYWDAEIKHAQEQGLNGYPVFTKKANTDLCYQFCAKKLLDSPNEIYGQFATHNAYTAEMIVELAGDKIFEFQRLHGMGQLLYKNLKKQFPNKTIPLRIYAPIGAHKDLLPYLVRRLLENGANSSFVNRFLDNNVPVEQLVKDPYTQILSSPKYENKYIPAPLDIFIFKNEHRKNAIGIDLDSPKETEKLFKKLNSSFESETTVGSIISGEVRNGKLHKVVNPANKHQVVGWYSEPSTDDMTLALEISHQGQVKWNQVSITTRVSILNRVANIIENNAENLISIICKEAGRTIPDCISEVREAVDFCRYYSIQAEEMLNGETQLNGRGTFLCISPWNFPLAIFVGQIAAALITGNSVIAKPAEQTPIVAFYVIKFFHAAGIPVDVLHLLLGSGSRIGSHIIPDSRIAGVTFTGSTETAKVINQYLSKRKGAAIPFIAETGGQNCMIVDSSALPEQVVDDVISSAFLSAGQRCSALRVLYLQSDIADGVIQTLKGTMDKLVIGNPIELSTDIGPVIDENARKLLIEHSENMAKHHKIISNSPLSIEYREGYFFPPQAFEIDSLENLSREVFGPILHIIRYPSKKLNSVLSEINNSGYGLTLGIHSRINAFSSYVFNNTNIGNTYINRNIVGAVVGVNPFGGRGASGTGPKAGGPNYLYKFVCSNINTSNQNSKRLVEIEKLDYNPVQLNQIQIEAMDTAQKEWAGNSINTRIYKLQNLLKQQDINDELSDFFNIFITVVQNKLTDSLVLPGPTGEVNILSLHPKGMLVCITNSDDSYISIGIQLITALLAGCSIFICIGQGMSQNLNKILDGLNKVGIPQCLIQIIESNKLPAIIKDSNIQGVFSNCYNKNSSELRKTLADRNGQILPLIELPTYDNIDDKKLWESYLTNFLYEKTLTNNIVATGGNTELFNLQE